MSDADPVIVGPERFEADANARGLDVEIVEHLEAQSLAEVAQMRGDICEPMPRRIMSSSFLSRTTS